jgi:hypothetical protein
VGNHSVSTASNNLSYDMHSGRHACKEAQES